MGIATVINNSFYSISLSLFSLIFINEYINQRAYLRKLINFLPDPYTILSSKTFVLNWKNTYKWSFTCLKCILKILNPNFL